MDHGGPREGNVILHMGLGHRLVYQRVDVFHLWGVKRQTAKPWVGMLDVRQETVTEGCPLLGGSANHRRSLSIGDSPTKSSLPQGAHPCCLLGKLQPGEEVMLGTQQGHLLKDTLLDLGNHQPHQHVQGGCTHIQAGSIGEVFLQVVKGTCMREKLLVAMGLASRRVRLLAYEGFPTSSMEEESANQLAHQTSHHNWWEKRSGVPPLLSNPSLGQQLSSPKPWATTVTGSILSPAAHRWISISPSPS